MLISLCIVAYNEQDFLNRILHDVSIQDYPKNNTEIILIDNGSTDSTKKIMEAFKSSSHGYSKISVISIPKSNLATACNKALEIFKGDIYVRVDAHSGLEHDFLSKIVKCISSGEKVCGGYRPCIVKNETPYQLMLLAAEESLFGSSFASYRRKHDEKCYMDSLFHIAFTRQVAEKAGKYNEALGRTEDNEFNYRLRRLGFKLCYSPEIKSYQIVRSSLGKMLRQKFLNGYWIGLTVGVCPMCISLFHFAPFALLLSILFCVLLCFFGIFFPIVLLLGAYALFDLLITVSAFLGDGKKYPCFLILPFIFPLLHLSYGLGTLIGIIKMPFWKRQIENKM